MFESHGKGGEISEGYFIFVQSSVIFKSKSSKLAEFARIRKISETVLRGLSFWGSPNLWSKIRFEDKPPLSRGTISLVGLIQYLHRAVFISMYVRLFLYG